MDPDIDPDRIDDAVLALLWLGLHEGWRTWKGFDWEAMDRLHRKGMISDPVGKAKSVVFAEAGRREAERLFRELFSRRSCHRQSYLGRSTSGCLPARSGMTFAMLPQEPEPG